MAQGEWMTMLSSDDRMGPGALSAYSRLIAALGDDASGTVLSSGVRIIDGDGHEVTYWGPDWKQWRGAVRNPALSAVVGSDVWTMPAAQLLANALRLVRTPFWFASTTYPRALHDAVEGYSQGGYYNPDKRFAWALLGVAKQAVFVDAPLFDYRIHASNQDAQQARAGAMKHLTDQYISTFSLDAELLAKASLTREELVAAFVEQDIALRGLKLLAENKAPLAARTLRYGQAVYPEQVRRNRKVWALRALLALGPAGQFLAERSVGVAQRAWERSLRQSSVN
jgi:hypothetical protein